MFTTNRRLRRERNEAYKRADATNHNADREFRKLQGHIHSLQRQTVEQMSEIEGLKVRLMDCKAERDVVVTKSNELWELVRNLRQDAED